MEIHMDMTCCRICLKSKNIMLDLFQPNSPGELFSDMLNECTTLQVDEADPLPSKICLICTQSLKNSCSFKRLAEKSNQILLSKLESTIVRFEDVKDENKLQFDSLEDIKDRLISASSVKPEPKYSFTVEVLDDLKPEPVQVPGVSDNIVICNTVIRKVHQDSASVDLEHDNSAHDSDSIVMEEEYLDDYLDDNDEDYEPPKALKASKPVSKKKKENPIKLESCKKIIASIKRNCSITVVNTHVKQFPRQKAIPVRDRMLTHIPLASRLTGNKGFVLNTNQRHVTEKRKPKKRYPLAMSNTSLAVSKETSPVVQKDCTPRQKEKHICPICGLLTFSLGAHLRTHDDKKPFCCEDCNKTFNQKGNYLMHRKRHTGIKDQICEICGAAFFFSKSVIRHKLIHKGERPFACTLCPKNFIARCDLTRHLKVHAGYKPYKCQECSMSFNAKHQLHNHERMHTGEKPFTCQVCNVAFSYKVNLNNHVMKIHGLNIKFKSVHTITAEVLSQHYQLPGPRQESCPPTKLPSLDA